MGGCGVDTGASRLDASDIGGWSIGASAVSLGASAVSLGASGVRLGASAVTHRSLLLVVGHTWFLLVA